jgi:CheY-like chemotaxis protein
MAIGMIKLVLHHVTASSGPDLLLVEDVRVSQKLAQQALSRAHFKVIVASDGETAVEQFKHNWNTLRIVLMDINLPGISGIEATEKIRRYEETLKLQHPDYVSVHIFGLTGNVDEENLRLYEQAGMNGCILKGKLLVDSVREAERQTSFGGSTFVNLVGEGQSTHSPTAASRY